MSKSEELKYRRSRYYTLLDSVKTINDRLSVTINDMKNATKIGEFFRIDNESADNDEIKKIREDVLNTKEFLTNSVEPEINYKISLLTRQIRASEAEEEAERLLNARN